MPKRPRSGEVSSPARVVEPISVNFGTGTFTERALGPLPDHDVELVVLHRRVEDLLDRRRHPVDLVDEEHLAFLEVGQHRREVARLLEHGPGGRPHRDAELVADHVGERRLPEARRAVEQDVVERLAALPRRGDRHHEVLAHPLLPDVLVERARPEPGLELRVLVDARRRDQAGIGHGGRTAIVIRRFAMRRCSAVGA